VSDDDDRIRIIGADEARAAMLRGEEPRRPGTTGDPVVQQGTDDDWDDGEAVEGDTYDDAYDDDWEEDDWGPESTDGEPVGDREPGRPVPASGAVLGADAVLRARAAQAPDPDPSVALPHWTEPPTGQLPSIFASDDDEDDDDGLDVWGGLAARRPEADDPWSPQASAAAADLGPGVDDGDLGPVADDVDLVGAVDDAELEPADDGQDLFAQGNRSRRLVPSLDDVAGPHGDPLSDPLDAALDEALGAGPLADDEHDLARQLGKPQRRRRVRGSSPTLRLDTAPDHDDPDYLAPPSVPPPPPADDLMMRIFTGGALLVVALLILRIGGRGPGSLMVGIIAGLATIEIYAAVRARGSRPATLLGIVAAAAFPPIAYLRGEAAYPMVIALFTCSVFVWYLVQQVRHRPALNVGMTMLGFGYVGVLASYGGLLLAFDKGVGMLIGVALCSVAHDVAGFAVGRHMGGARIAPQLSPNKTVNGLLGGVLASIVVGAAVVGQIAPFDPKSGFALGVVVAITAPTGDLVESMLKRDLGIKDFGGLLPGHGGVLDRFDAILFSLPAAYYLIRVGNFFG
jgi:phosphatidate cytidylyltransferase